VPLLEQLCTAALGTAGIERVTCTEAFLAHAGVDPLSAGLADMLAAVVRAGIAVPDSVDTLPEVERWDRAFEALLAEVVQPQLGRGRPTVLEAWPRSQAAFARLDPSRPVAARRFELFIAGVELANGWEEETDRAALAARIDAANRVRIADGRGSLPVPRRHLAAHGASMPAGVGAALGFERLAMLAAGADSLDAVRCFNSQTA
jgi:lysyl-tRNA synthetase class 2